MAELSPHTGRARTHRAAQWAYFLAAGLVVFAVLALLALQSAPARGYALDQARKILAQQGITFSTEDFRYNLLALSTDLRAVRIVSPLMPDGPPFIEIDHARIDLSTWQVLRGHYVVDAASADGVRVHYFVDANGTDNLPRPVKNPDDQSRPLDYLIRNLRVPDASVRYENRAQGIDLAIPRASLAMNGNMLTGRHAITIEAPGGDLHARDRSAHLDRIAAVLDLGKDDVKIERAELQAEQAVIDASGTVGPFAAPVIDIKLQAAVDAARAVEVANLGERVSGQFAIDVSLKGPLDALAVDAHAKGSNLQVRALSGLEIDYRPRHIAWAKTSCASRGCTWLGRRARISTATERFRTGRGTIAGRPDH